MSTFLDDYARIVAAAISADFTDNFDGDRFEPEPRNWRPLARNLRGKLARFGWVGVGTARQIVQSSLQFVVPHLTGLEWLYARLGDEESRRLLVSVVAFRALGHRRIKLPLNCPEHWARIRSLKQLAHGSETIDSGFNGWRLSKLDLNHLGYPIQLFLTPGGVVTDFIEQQYRCETPDGPIECGDGDVAIDAGGCWGDTALYFAHRVGAAGQVASFEFLPENLKIYEQNLRLNPGLAKRIRLFENPVWSCSGVDLFVAANGPGTSVATKTTDPSEPKVQTVCIDDLVNQRELSRVDFMKLDIEGAELAALQGSAQTLKLFKPRLAVTVYHRLEDFWTIPQYLDQLALGYRFYLRHFTIHSEETVLFAKASV